MTYTVPALNPKTVIPDVLTQRRTFRVRGLVLAAIAIIAVSILSILVGVRAISLDTTWNAIFDFDPQNSEHLLVVHLRIPRTILALIVGAAFGVAGVIMQALTRNPLADPGILGVNSGAAVAVVIGIAGFGVQSVTGYMMFGIVGAGLAGLLVYLLGGVRTGTNPVRLVLAGAALSVVLLSLTHIVLVNSEDQVFDQYRHWIVGSLQGRGYEVLLPVAVLTLIGVLLALSLTKSLDAVSLGDDLARSLGVSSKWVWGVGALTVMVLAGAATAAAGPIGFIGLTAPHLARFLVGPDHKWLIPYAIVISALLTVSADVLGRVIALPGEVGVGIMVALIGGPFFVALVRRRKLVQL